MKSNVYRIIVSCLCVWAIGMATEENQETKSINEGMKTKAKVEANVQLQKKMVLKKKAALQADVKAKHGLVVEIMDQVKAAGVNRVSVAARG